MYDFRLKVFDAVVRNQSFTRAANELYISQPAVSKHIIELEKQYSMRIFDRLENKAILTKGGRVLHSYALRIFKISEEANEELSSFIKQKKGSLKLGASTTIAHYLIAPILAKFYEKYPDVDLDLLNGNSEIIERALMEKSIDLGIVEGQKRHPEITYRPFADDELVCVTSCNSKYAKVKSFTLDELMTIPLILRERGSGTLEVIENALKEKGLKPSRFNIIMNLGSTESIKSFLEHANAVSIMSEKAVQKEVSYNQLKIIPIENFKINRQFNFVYLKGFPEKWAAIFMKFTLPV